MSTVNVEGKGMWKAEIDSDVADNIAVRSLISSHRTMVENLENYKIPDHRWIATFSTDEEEDIKQLKKMRDALALVINHWYGGKVDEATEVIAGECGVTLLQQTP
jgi:formyltetrahydrofolate synthetase